LISTSFLLDAAGWTWIVVIAGLIVGGYFFLDKLMRKGIYDETRMAVASSTALSQNYRHWWTRRACDA
jgi:hypothetical protein